ncbi:hypothetical protein GJ744_001301 [Endocarpon pusillum]|uniref:Major facilitator superfamily (MFS) profile domain-containing protein n=1 Tax=Endocarpon pusillum TaxID=364733 RepID=A0A8H7ACB9_9EURO|nr:hypothetical protein GJ744_001301 [Endocarpon pusillum]
MFVFGLVTICQGLVVSTLCDHAITFKDVVNVFKDYKIIVGGFMYFGLIVPAYGYAYFAPSIIRTYGYSPIQTQLHSVPPWATAFGFSMLVAWASDRMRHRFLFTLVPIAIGIAGFAILLTGTRNLDLRYAALFLVTSGVYSAMRVIVCWSPHSAANEIPEIRPSNIHVSQKPMFSLSRYVGYSNFDLTPTIDLVKSEFDASKEGVDLGVNKVLFGSGRLWMKYRCESNCLLLVAGPAIHP